MNVPTKQPRYFPGGGGRDGQGLEVGGVNLLNQSKTSAAAHTYSRTTEA